MKPLIAFLVAAFGLSWAVAPPLWLGDVAAPPDLVVAGPGGMVDWVLLAVCGASLLEIFPVRTPQPAS